jgi:hypothetical protein
VLKADRKFNDDNVMFRFYFKEEKWENINPWLVVFFL